MNALLLQELGEVLTKTTFPPPSDVRYNNELAAVVADYLSLQSKLFSVQLKFFQKTCAIT